MLEVRGLTVRFPGAPRAVVDGVDLEVERGSVLGIVGETGAGKTLTTRAILRAIRDAEVTAERIDFEGVDLLNAPRGVLQRVRGNKIAVIVQDARSALNPMQTVGTSIRHIVRTHEGVGRREARARTLAMLESVGLADPESVIRRYPHELSGGMAQRVVIAAALVTNPDLVIADEATTGLDLTVQAQILDLLRAEIAKRNAAAILVTHDLGIVAHYCKDVVVMYAGRVRERGPVREVFAAPAHPYTATLLAATRRAAADRGPDAPPPAWDTACAYASRCRFTEEICLTGPLPLQRAGARSSLCRLPISGDAPREPAPVPAATGGGTGAPAEGQLVRAESLRKTFSRPGGERLHAVNGVDLEIRAGETLALVGESGAGKSTVGRCLLKLTDVDSGQILLEGVDITREPRRAFRHRRTHVQAVFQDPASSLDARMRAVDIVTEPVAIFRPELGRVERRAEGLRLMASVGLGEELADRFPRQLSGGQQQRVAIARAISTHPRLVVLDEPTASLDMSVRGQVLGLLRDLQRDHGLSYLLISHDLQTVLSLSERIVVMYLGEIVETGPTAEVFRRPRHPYTKALLSATLIPDPARPPAHVPLRGEIPKPTALPHGCFLAGRCPLAIAECRAEHPPLFPVGDAHAARCIRLDQT